MTKNLSPTGTAKTFTTRTPKQRETSKPASYYRGTDSAIKGPLCGDAFWGSGAYAADIAGKMKSSGVKWVLLPKQGVEQ